MSALTIGSLLLTPAFASDTLSYTADTTNATNTINAVASDAGAVIVIENNGVTVANGSAITWASGINMVTITVTSGTFVTTYTVVVTKS